tara:strand:- start:14701 stop:15435 length:735 start_codon:yes stop_codon:yes gene_type:complete
MKYITFLVLFFASINSNAQLQEILTQNDWYLSSLTIDGEVYMPPVNLELAYVQLNFNDTNSEITFETQVCNYGIGYITLDENNNAFSFIDGEFIISLIECSFQENSLFEGQYLGFYFINASNPFNVNIIWIDDPYATEELLGIEVISANGDSALYHNWLLSTEDFTTSDFKIVPNPVTDSFYISFTANKNMTALIYDITGKLILTRNDLESKSSVNIENIKAGIYFVHISDEQGNTWVERIIKK